MFKKTKDKTKEEIMVENLKDVKEIFDKNKVRFWLDCGTLLGAVREGRFISWEDDVDIATTIDEFDKIKQLIPVFVKKGFSVHIASDFAIGIIRNLVRVDIDIYRIKSDKHWLIKDNNKTRMNWRLSRLAYIAYYKKLEHPKTLKIKIIKWLIPTFAGNFIRKLAMSLWMFLGGRYVPLVFPKDYFEKLNTISFYNMQFNIPSSVKDYLTLKYGNWSQPNSCWNFFIEDKGIDYSFKIDRWKPLI